MAFLTTLEKSVVALQILGLILLAMLFCTFKLSSVHDRHSLFMNFLVAWLMYSAYTTFHVLTIVALPPTIAQPGVAIIRGALLDFFSIVSRSVVATLNLIIHLWFKTRSALTAKLANDSVEGWLTVVLLVSPYLIGLLCLTELFSVWSDKVFAYIFLSVMVIASLWDMLLLAMFLFNHRVVRLAVQRDLLPLSLLVRLLIFSVLRLVYCGVSLSLQTLPSGANIRNNAPVTNSKLEQAELVIQILIPISVFALFGLRLDILRIWFPCLALQQTQKRALNMTTSENDSTRALVPNDMESQAHSDSTQTSQSSQYPSIQKRGDVVGD